MMLGIAAAPDAMAMDIYREAAVTSSTEAIVALRRGGGKGGRRFRVVPSRAERCTLGRVPFGPQFGTLGTHVPFCARQWVDRTPQRLAEHAQARPRIRYQPLVRIAAQWLERFEEVPPRQKPASFSLDVVMDKRTPKQ